MSTSGLRLGITTPSLTQRKSHIIKTGKMLGRYSKIFIRLRVFKNKIDGIRVNNGITINTTSLNKPI